jgi:GNAT superfamily N-acetyltransferase
VIRPAGEADLPLILDMGRELHAATGLPGRYDPKHFAARVTRMDGFVSPRGAILGIVTPSMWSPDVLVAWEGFWWATDGNGMALLRAFEGWARESGATRVQIGTQHAYRGEAVGRLLEREGYAMRETYWTKGL